MCQTPTNNKKVRGGLVFLIACQFRVLGAPSRRRLMEVWGGAPSAFRRFSQFLNKNEASAFKHTPIMVEKR